MSEHVAIVGSRKGANLEEVRAFARALFAQQPDTILVSGGADGADKAAESEWMQLGGKVLSIRVKKIEEGVYGIQEWRLGSWEHCEVRDMPEEPTWADFPSAAFYRDSLIAERAKRVVAFFSNYRTSGTQVTLDFAAGAKAETYEYFNRV